MFVRVKFLVDLRALEPEIGAQIDHDAARRDERNGVFRRDAVRQGEKNDVGLFGEKLGVRLGEAERLGFRMAGEFGNTCASDCPAFWREVTATSSACG